MYTIKEASARSGVGVPLLRAWERRYGVVAPRRTASGYRVYDDEAITRLRAMRRLITDGWSAQQAAARIGTADAAALHELVGGLDNGISGGAETRAPGDPAPGLVSRMVDASRRLDSAAMEDALDAAFASGRFEAVADRILMPALRAVGAAWERGDVSVAGEHAASAAVQRRLAMAYEAAGATGSSAPVLVGLGPGARHELGALAFAIAARRAGLPTLYLGADLPAESWQRAAADVDARAAVIGVPTRADVQRARAVLSALRDARSDALLAVGGAEASRLLGAPDVVVLPAPLVESVRAFAEALRARTSAGR